MGMARKKAVIGCILIAAVMAVIVIIGGVFYESAMFFVPGEVEFNIGEYKAVGRIILEAALYLSVIAVPTAVLLILYAFFEKSAAFGLCAAAIGIVLAGVIFYGINADYIRGYSEMSRLYASYGDKMVDCGSENTDFTPIKSADGSKAFEYRHKPCIVLIYTSGAAPSAEEIGGHPLQWCFLRLDKGVYVGFKVFNCRDF